MGRMTASETTGAAPSLAPVAGFWRRSAAFLMDCFLLAVVGWAIGIAAYDELVEAGGWALLLGATIAIVYFALFDGPLAPSPGKRFFRLRVVDGDGRALPLARAALRCLLLAVPWFASGAPLPAALAGSPWSAVGQQIVVYAWGGALVFLYLFNRATGQSLHDLATGSYVVDASGGGRVPAQRRMPRRQILLVAGWVALIVAWIVAVGARAWRAPDAGGEAVKLTAAESAIAALPGVRRVALDYDDGTRAPAAAPRFRAQLFVTEWPRDGEAFGREVVSAVRAAGLPCAGEESFTVVLSRGFAMGIASFWHHDSRAHSCAEWLAAPATP
jgi:uncharacterized RDD family membrane protein YckC